LKGVSLGWLLLYSQTLEFMFASKAGANPVKHLSGVPLKIRLLALPTNFRLGWKGPWTNTLAH